MNSPEVDVTPADPPESDRCGMASAAVASEPAAPPEPIEQEKFVARLYGGSALLAMGAVIFAAVANLEWSFPVDEFGLAFAFMVVFALQTRFRIDAGNSTRRTNEALSEAPIVLGMFWLEPWPLIVSLLLGVLIAFEWNAEMLWRWRVFNVASQLLVYVIVARIVVWIDATNAHDGYRAALVAITVWFIADLVRLGPYFIMNWSIWGTVRFDLVPSTFAPTTTRAMAAGVGLVIAMAWEATPWSLVALAPLLAMFYRSAASANRVVSLETGIAELSKLAATTSASTELAQIERALLDAETTIGGFHGAAIARPADPADPDGAVAWNGNVPNEAKANLATIAALRAIADTEPVLVPTGPGAIGVWTLDVETSRFLVIASHRSSRLDDLWVMTGHLVTNARQAMANAHQQAALCAVAEREYWRARTDESTGLPNEFAARVELDRRLEAGLSAPLGVVAMSLNGYKQLVDVMGPERGDEAIAAFATRIGAVSGVEFLARVGRAEFVLFTTGGITEVINLAECARRVDAEPDDTVAALRDASAGVAVAYPKQNMSGAKLLSRAALALGRAESLNEVVAFGDAELAAEERRVDIRLRLRESLAKRELWPAFQPQIDLRTGEVAGLEVLARWKNPDLGVIAPREFIGVAEQSNQIERLTILMLEQALDAHRGWTANGATFPISVNLSARSLAHPKFLALLVGIVKQSGLPAEMLTLEITESTLVESAETVEALSKLADLGGRISIDDFGTGFSSLSYLERLPVHELKIDRSMVMPLEQRSTISPVLRWLIHMSQDLGYVLVAEGIETEKQFRALHSLNVGVGQGYLLARPMPADETTIWLRNYRPPELMADQDSIELVTGSDGI